MFLRHGYPPGPTIIHTALEFYTTAKQHLKMYIYIEYFNVE